MTPAYAVVADDTDVTGRLRQALAELRVTTTTDRTTDTVEIRLAGDAVAAPPAGTALRVSVGYAQTGLIEVGLFLHSETEIELAPASRILIRGTGADLRPDSALKTPRSRAWGNTTLGAIVGEIASEHGLTPAVDAALGATPISHLDQTAESDLHFLRRLAARWDADAKVAAERLLFTAAAAAATASGAPMPPIELTPTSGVTSARVTYRGRPEVSSVRARYVALADADVLPHVVAGTGDPVHDLPDPYANAAYAQAAADAKLAQLTRAAAQLEATIPGTPTLSAGAPITTTGWPSAANGRWIATRVTHAITPNGFTTELTATPPTP